jgi:hypothetical protein
VGQRVTERSAAPEVRDLSPVAQPCPLDTAMLRYSESAADGSGVTDQPVTGVHCSIRPYQLPWAPFGTQVSPAAHTSCPRQAVPVVQRSDEPPTDERRPGHPDIIVGVGTDKGKEPSRPGKRWRRLPNPARPIPTAHSWDGHRRGIIGPSHDLCVGRGDRVYSSRMEGARPERRCLLLRGACQHGAGRHEDDQWCDHHDEERSGRIP